MNIVLTASPPFGSTLVSGMMYFMDLLTNVGKILNHEEYLVSVPWTQRFVNNLMHIFNASNIPALTEPLYFFFAVFYKSLAERQNQSVLQENKNYDDCSMNG
jgi:hypothetical protein